MAAPSIPQNFWVQTANQEVLSSWNLVAGATGYIVQRSPDAVTYATLATITATQYVDDTATLGTLYFYRVAATNSAGTSAYTAAQSAVPTISGEQTLGQIRLQAQQRADRVNSQFLTLPEWNSNINQSMLELYDLLVSLFEDYYLAPMAKFTTTGNTFQYDLPNGVATFQDQNGSDFIPAPLYKLRGVDLGLSNANNGYVSMDQFMFADRNKFVYPNSASTIYGVFNCQYRMMGNKIEFIPTPSAGQPIRLWYIPRLELLLRDTDTTAVGISGWTEYIIVDAAIKALQKEESDCSLLMTQKLQLIKRIEAAASNRDAGSSQHISDTRSNGPWGGQGTPWGTGRGGF